MDTIFFAIFVINKCFYYLFSRFLGFSKIESHICEISVCPSIFAALTSSPTRQAIEVTGK